VSGLVDVHSPKAVEPLLNSLGNLTKENRALAIDGLIRTPGRAKALIASLASGKAQFAWLSDAQIQTLLKHPDEDVRRDAEKVLKK